jgi:ABC-type multidrug transport system ATPase subunit
MIAIMGQSGCGKSTTDQGAFYRDQPHLRPDIDRRKNLDASINYYLESWPMAPQEDLLYPNLSVFENLYYRLKLRNPLLPASKLIQKVQIIMQQVNLSHHRIR